MDAPPPPQPDAAAAAPSSTSASAPPPAPPPNLAPSVSTAAPPTSDSTPAPAPTPAPPAQTLEPPAPNPASVRPPPPRMRPPYTHLASPITTSSSSSPAAAAASSSATPGMPRGGVAIGLPAHPRGAQTPVGYTGFVPPPPLAHQFSSMHRGPDQPTPPNPQRTPTHALTRPLSTGSPSTALQQTPPNVSSPFRPQQRPQVPQPRPYHVAQSALAASHQHNVLSGQQQLPQNQLLQQQQQKSQAQHSSQQNQQNTTLKTQQQAARTPVPLAQKPDSPATLQATNMQLVDMASSDAAAGESINRLLSKRSINELVAQIDPAEKLDPEVEDVIMDIGEDFIESVLTFACSLAKHRKSSTLESKDVLLHAEKSWNITLPGFTGDEIKLYKKPHVNDIHRERLTLIKKSMVSEGNIKGNAQAAANQKNQNPKPPATGSP